MSEEHKGDVIAKVDDRKFAYHDEISYPGAYIKSRPSDRSTDHVERKKYDEYEFTITKHTDNSMVVNLRKHRADIRAQRVQNGKAILHEDYNIILSFGELMNRIFGDGCHIYLEEEHFPDEIAEHMKTVYGD